MFKIDGAAVAQRRVHALAIVPNLQVFKDGRTGLGAGTKRSGDAFGLQGAKEALDHGVIPAIALATHRAAHSILGKLVLERLTRIPTR